MFFIKQKKIVDITNLVLPAIKKEGETFQSSHKKSRMLKRTCNKKKFSPQLDKLSTIHRIYSDIRQALKWKPKQKNKLTKLT
jgi:hypothetical protein